jgi:non-heme chloroperoxidase
VRVKRASLIVSLAAALTVTAAANAAPGSADAAAASVAPASAVVAPTHAAPEPADTSPHKVQFITVDKGVRLEVLDWGGTGRPLVLLTGQGATAHVFDEFALNFTAHHHVYGITRRGYGRSDKPAPTPENYDANRLGDDVLAVIDALKLDRPFVAGHSIAGEELSSIGSRHPERVAGLIYLDAHGPSAFYDPTVGSYEVDMAELLRRLKHLSTVDPQLEKLQLQQLQQSGLLRQFQRQVARMSKNLESLPPTPPNAAPDPPNPVAAYNLAQDKGQRAFIDVKGPLLVIAAAPHERYKGRPPKEYERETQRLTALEKRLPNARIVRIPFASHFIYRSNEAQVVREMNAFMDGIDDASLPVDRSAIDDASLPVDRSAIDDASLSTDRSAIDDASLSTDRSAIDDVSPPADASGIH